MPDPMLDFVDIKINYSFMAESHSLVERQVGINDDSWVNRELWKEEEEIS